jgi:hypothetical protein
MNFRALFMPKNGRIPKDVVVPVTGNGREGRGAKPVPKQTTYVIPKAGKHVGKPGRHT